MPGQFGSGAATGATTGFPTQGSSAASEFIHPQCQQFQQPPNQYSQPQNGQGGGADGQPQHFDAPPQHAPIGRPIPVVGSDREGATPATPWQQAVAQGAMPARPGDCMPGFVDPSLPKDFMKSMFLFITCCRLQWNDDV